MSPKLIRLLFVASLVTGFGAPMFVASAASGSGVDVHDPEKGGFVVPHAEPPNRLELAIGGTVTWTVWEGKHNVTPKDGRQWGSASPELTPESDLYSKQFKSAGDYFYFCSIHSGADDVGKPGVGMWGLVHVFDPTPTTQPPATQPPSTQPPATQPPATQPPATQPPRPGATPPATTATVPTTTRATPTTAAPTTTAPKGDKDKKQKEETTTTIPALTPPPPPIDLPDEAIIPTLPGASTPGSVEPGAPGAAPADTPEGEAVALLKGKKSGGEAMKLLIVSGLGLGALGVGTAGYKYSNRSSKYFPA